MERAMSLTRILNTPMRMSKHQDDRDIRQNAREILQREGITLNPWVVTLILGFIMNLVGFAFTWGTVVTRIEALDARIQRIERQLDAQERTRGLHVP